MDGSTGIGYTREKRLRAAALGYKRKPRKDIEELTGRTFFWLTVQSRVPTELSGRRNSRWLCRCKCGNEREVDQDKLKGGETKSCGCYRRTVHVYYTRQFLETSRKSVSWLQFDQLTRSQQETVKQRYHFLGFRPGEHYRRSWFITEQGDLLGPSKHERPGQAQGEYVRGLKVVELWPDFKPARYIDRVIFDRRAAG